ncbi:hypothetical protein D3C72_1859250 [compost metagenome]
MPPTSRPPMALGWPVSDKGPQPDCPIWPVAKCRLISAAFLAVPLLLWFNPWQYRLSVGPRPGNAPSPPSANQRAACSRSCTVRPQSRATRSGVASRTKVFSVSNPEVWRSM